MDSDSDSELDMPIMQFASSYKDTKGKGTNRKRAVSVLKNRLPTPSSSDSEDWTNPNRMSMSDESSDSESKKQCRRVGEGTSSSRHYTDSNVAKRVCRKEVAVEESKCHVTEEVATIVAYLRKKMDGMRKNVFEREASDNDSYDKNELPSWRNNVGMNTEHSLVNLEDLMSSDTTFVEYRLFCQMTHHESQLAVLGGSDVEHRVLLRRSNKETRTFDFVYKHMELLVSPLALRSRLFTARPEQLLAVGEKLAMYDVDISCDVHRMGVKTEDAAQYTRRAFTRPSIDLFNYATGNGKTWATLLGSMTDVSNKTLWSNMQSTWRDTVKTNSVQPNLGLCKCSGLENNTLARVVIAMIPEQLIHQWEKTAEAVHAAMEKQHGLGFHIWSGLSKIQRSTKRNPGGIERTLMVANSMCESTGRALLWIVPATTVASKHVLRSYPKIAVAVRLYDECSKRTEPKSKAYESFVMKNVIIQATVERLETATRAQSEHPLRKALGGEDFDSKKSRHAAIFHLLTAPDWLRLMLSEGMHSLMPSGIRKVSLKVRLQSLAARVNSSDINITSLDELLAAMLKSAGSNRTKMQPHQKRDFLARCSGILGQSKSDDKGVTIHARLGAALADINCVVQAMPSPPQRTHIDVPVPEAEIVAYADIENEKQVMNVMIRMLTNLSTAVCVDPAPECPITMEEIPAEFVGIFPCCTNLFDVRHKDALNGKCPMCRAPLLGVIVASQAVDVIVQGSTQKTNPVHEEQRELENVVGDEPALVERLSKMATETKFTTASGAVAETIRQYLSFKSKGARILLAFTCRWNEDENDGTQKTRELLLADVPALTSVLAINRKKSSVVENFVVNDDSNRVLVINTGSASSSLEGLDLHNTDLIIIDRLLPGHLTAGKIVQTIGRAMRPQAKHGKESTTMDFDAPSPFASKMVVLLDVDREANIQE